ncbi:hypothetical protein PSP6_540055 [Paraburkholderia tropica]|uniref:hypothetical protein n=1 Tax=Paraburkholderia tropica TaxID=92647 RepID=UPI001CAE2A8D|nr:hypothetical protein [Paraburkholderia tropica]CAG9230116.1 hypothetical protein PSP6_540055 [Paraburkholderia tropica]
MNDNKQKILRAVGLLGVLILLTGTMLQSKRPATPHAIVFVPDAHGCRITYPAGTNPAPETLPKGTLVSAECLVAR